MSAKVKRIIGGTANDLSIMVDYNYARVIAWGFMGTSKL